MNVKRAHEYSREELLALEPVDILRLKDLEAMCEGAPLLPRDPGPEPAKLSVIGKQMAYKVTAELLFFNEADAQEVLALIRSKARADSYYLGGNYQGPHAVKPEDPEQGNLTAERFWTPEQWAEHKLAQEAYSQAYNRWSLAYREHQAAVKARAKAVERVDQLLEAAQEEERRRNDIQTTFNTYLELAGGDHNTAVAFLRKLDKWPEDTIDQVLFLGRYAPPQPQSEVNLS